MWGEEAESCTEFGGDSWEKDACLSLRLKPGYSDIPSGLGEQGRGPQSSAQLKRVS